MYLDLFTSDIQVAWRATLLKGPAYSRHLLMAIIFNVLNLLQLGKVFKEHRGMPYLGLFLTLMVFLLIMFGYYAAALYRQTRDRLKTLPDDSIEAQTLLRVSYLGYRLYLTGLGFGFVILDCFNLVHWAPVN